MRASEATHDMVRVILFYPVLFLPLLALLAGMPQRKDVPQRAVIEQYEWRR